MPKEWIANVIEIVNRIAIVTLLDILILVDLDYICREYSAFEVDSVCDVDFTEIDEVMGSLKVLDSLLHQLDVKIIFGEKVLVPSCGAPISCIKIWWYFLTPDDPDIFGQNRIHHVGVTHLWRSFHLTPIFWLLYVCSQIQSNDVAHCWNSFISPTRPRERFICRKGFGNEAERVHHFEDILLYAIIRFWLAGHAVVVVTQVANLKRVFPHLKFLE